MKAFSAPLILALSLLPTHAQTLGGFENFSEQGNAESWGEYNFDTDETFTPFWQIPGSNNPEIYTLFTANNGVSLFADDLSSSAFFVGDYASTGIDQVSCDVYIEDVSTFSEMEFYFVSDDVFYFSDSFTVDNSGWSSLTNSFTKNQWYTFEDGDFFPATITPEILFAVVEIGVNFFPSSEEAIDSIVGLDNFALLPDLTPPELTVAKLADTASISFTQAAGISYNVEFNTSLAPNNWGSLTSDSSNIQGEGPWESTITAPEKAFFRVSTTPLLIQATRS